MWYIYIWYIYNMHMNTFCMGITSPRRSAPVFWPSQLGQVDPDPKVICPRAHFFRFPGAMFVHQRTKNTHGEFPIDWISDMVNVPFFHGEFPMPGNQAVMHPKRLKFLLWLGAAAHTIRCRPCIATVTTVMPSLDDMAEHTAHAHGDCTAVSSTHLNMFVIGDNYAEHGWTCCGSRKCLNQLTKFCNKILDKYSDNSCERTVLASVLAICQSSAHKHIMLDQETADNQWSPNDQWVNTWLPKNCDWRPSKSVAYSVAFPRFCSANVGDKEKNHPLMIVKHGAGKYFMHFNYRKIMHKWAICPY